MLNEQKITKQNPASFVTWNGGYDVIAEKALQKVQDLIKPYTYNELNAKNKVLANGIFFHTLFNEFLSYLNINFNDPYLKTGAGYTVRETISKSEYEQMPKKYRELFMQYDSEYYILRDNDAPFKILSVEKNANKKVLKDLLERARVLIPCVYTTKWRENQTPLNGAEIAAKKLNGTIAETVTEPAFVPNKSFSGKFVSKQQKRVLNELREIFVAISDITKSYQRNYNKCYEIAPGKYLYKDSAFDIYKEYRDELTRKNRYLNAQKAINTAKGKGLQTLIQQAKPEERSGLQTLADVAKKNSESERQRIIADLMARTK